MGLDRHPLLWTPPVRPVVGTEKRVREAVQRQSVRDQALRQAVRFKAAGNREMAARFAAVAGVPFEEL